MMGFAALAADRALTVFDRLGEPAVYTPGAGAAPISLMVIPGHNNQPHGGDVRSRDPRLTMTVQRADVDEPRHGDCIELDGGGRYIVGTILHRDEVCTRLAVSRG